MAMSSNDVANTFKALASRSPSTPNCFSSLPKSNALVLVTFRFCKKKVRAALVSVFIRSANFFCSAVVRFSVLAISA